MPAKWSPKVPKGFPLTVTPRGYMKSIGGRSRWICGKVTPEEAITIYHRKAAAITSGGTVLPVKSTKDVAATMVWLFNKWLKQRLADADAKEITHGMYDEYRRSAKRITLHGGHILADDWTPDTTQQVYNAIRKTDGADAAKRAIGHLRTACRHAEEMKWCRPIAIGVKVVNKLSARPQATMQWKLYTPDQIRSIIDTQIESIRTSTPAYLPSRRQFLAMLYLALNGGYGAMELSQLPKAVIDLDIGYIDYRRGKTGQNHVVPLWPETVEALRPVLKQRPNDELLFRTREGNPWCRREVTRVGNRVKVQPIDNVKDRFDALVKPLGLKFAGQAFYKLKHLHATTADRAGDPHATFRLAGHGLPGAKGHYVDVGLDRVEKVVSFIRHELLIRGVSPTTCPQPGAARPKLGRPRNGSKGSAASSKP